MPYIEKVKRAKWPGTDVEIELKQNTECLVTVRFATNASFLDPCCEGDREIIAKLGFPTKPDAPSSEPVDCGELEEVQG